MAQGSDSNDTSYKSPSPGSRPVSPLPPSQQRAPASALRSVFSSAAPTSSCFSRALVGRACLCLHVLGCTHGLQT
ncbi:unnamed protein product [Tetraodon nigroviridis]|uniref:(spotted green pufferfish) hypothetical protein n=1 Tax=Tetraodon nigroviridis TaxID=99883 RepID=Q4RR52_TETNG|nr:unnamed protein product [Tetraodon nigroviridis]